MCRAFLFLLRRPDLWLVPDLLHDLWMKRHLCWQSPPLLLLPIPPSSFPLGPNPDYFLFQSQFLQTQIRVSPLAVAITTKIAMVMVTLLVVVTLTRLLDDSARAHSLSRVRPNDPDSLGRPRGRDSLRAARTLWTA